MSQAIIQVRCLPDGEFGPIEPLLRRIYSQENPELLASWVRAGGSFPFVQWYVAVHESEVVGFTRWHLYDVNQTEIMLMLSWTAVHPDWEGHGVMHQLVEQSFREVENHWSGESLRISSAWVETDLTNTHARHFYKSVFENLGFKAAEHEMAHAWKEGSTVFITGTRESS